LEEAEDGGATKPAEKFQKGLFEKKMREDLARETGFWKKIGFRGERGWGGGELLSRSKRITAPEWKNRHFGGGIRIRKERGEGEKLTLGVDMI